MTQEKKYYEYLLTRSSFSKIYRNVFLYRVISLFLNQNILEVGSGIGDFLKYNKNAVGIDVNPYLVDHCQKIGLNVQLSDKNQIPYNNEFFESCLLDNVIEHLEEPTTLMSEITRVLKPNGTLIIGVPGEKGYKNDPDHKVFYNKESLKVLVEAFEFKLKRSFCMPLPFNFASKFLSQHCLYCVFNKR